MQQLWSSQIVDNFIYLDFYCHGVKENTQHKLMDERLVGPDTNSMIFRSLPLLESHQRTLNTSQLRKSAQAPKIRVPWIRLHILVSLKKMSVVRPHRYYTAATFFFSQHRSNETDHINITAQMFCFAEGTVG